MSQTIYVVSDLHLGGAPADPARKAPDFRMCSEAGQARLAAFFRWVAMRAAKENVHLVLAGDIVDFLAEREFSALTVDESMACAKLQTIFNRTAEVWAALRDVLCLGRLTLLMGNHDPELSFPGPRRLLLDTLGPGRIDFLYDNQALCIGDVLIEHGNQYDTWNVIPPDPLRKLRSRLSRGLRPKTVPKIPGSTLVVEVMNDIKITHPWVDLLKPERHSVFPLLAALNPGAIVKLWDIAGQYARSLRAHANPGWQVGGGLPEDDEKGRVPIREEELGMEEAMSLAFSIVGAPNPTQVGAWLDKVKGWVTDGGHAIADEALYRGLRFFAAKQVESFSIGREVKDYLRPARRTAARGFRVVVFGHTHLAKQVPLIETARDTGEEHQALYLNTGTWADLIRMPEAIFADSGDFGRAELGDFISDLKAGQITKWRRQVPSYARIIVDNKMRASDRGLFFFYDESNPARPASGDSLWDFAA